MGTSHTPTVLAHHNRRLIATPSLLCRGGEKGKRGGLENLWPRALRVRIPPSAPFRLHPDNMPSIPHRKMGGHFMGTTEHKNMLLEMKEVLAERLEKARADYEAVERLIAVHKEMSLPDPATVEEIRLAAIDVLAQCAEPIHRQTLLDKLEDIGIRVNGKVPVNSLGSILSRFSDDFQPLGNGIWGLRASPLPKESVESTSVCDGEVASHTISHPIDGSPWTQEAKAPRPMGF